MDYKDKVALVLALAVLAPLVLHLWRTRPRAHAATAAWRAAMVHPVRPGVQWPWRPYDHAQDGL